MTRKQSLRTKKKNHQHSNSHNINSTNTRNNAGKVVDENKQPSHTGQVVEETPRSSKFKNQQGYGHGVLKTPSRNNPNDHKPTHAIHPHDQKVYTNFQSVPLKPNSYYSNTHSYRNNNSNNHADIPAVHFAGNSNHRHSKYTSGNNQTMQFNHTAYTSTEHQTNKTSAFSKYSGHSNHANTSKHLFSNRSRSRRSSRNRYNRGQRHHSHQPSHQNQTQKRRASSDKEQSDNESETKDASLGGTLLRERLMRASSPTPSTWSLSTTATFKNDMRDSQFQDMVETFRENDLNNMEKSQILQEYRFMERVNHFLEEKIERLPTPKNLEKLLRRKRRKKEQVESVVQGKKTKNGSDTTEKEKSSPTIVNASDSDDRDKAGSDEAKESSVRARLSSTSSAGSSAHSSNKLGDAGGALYSDGADPYHHGRYEPDELTQEQLLNEHEMYTTEQQATLNCLNALGVDPINSIDSIREHLDLIEMQVSERHRQLDDEKELLVAKLSELTGNLEGVRSSTGSPSN